MVSKQRRACLPNLQFNFDWGYASPLLPPFTWLLRATSEASFSKNSLPIKEKNSRHGYTHFHNIRRYLMHQELCNRFIFINATNSS